MHWIRIAAQAAFSLWLGLSPIILYAYAPTHTFSSQKQLKKALFSVYQQNPVTFLCAQKFNPAGEINVKPCQHCPKVTSKIVWMPIVPYEQLAQHLTCYKEKICLDKQGKTFRGVRCCQELDSHFKMASQDLHNFVPELKYIKQQRRQFAFSILSEVSNEPSQCQLVLNKKEKRIHTPLAIRGVVARAYLYMRETYFLPLSEEEVALYQTWHRQYPASAQEIARNEMISQFQKNKNPYI